MKKLTRKAQAYIANVVDEVVGRNGMKGASLCDDDQNPFLYLVFMPIETDEQVVAKTCNELFHVLELLPQDKDLALGELSAYCHFVRVGSAEEAYYIAVFNHPAVFALKESDPEYRFILANWRNLFNGKSDKPVFQELIDGIKTGRLKSKTPDGYLVLKGEFYDRIAAGTKTVEYRDFTEYSLKRTIGLKTVRFNRGYVKNAPQMKWEVKKVVLLDGDDNECDPFNVPEDFCPMTIAIHLGKRIG